MREVCAEEEIRTPMPFQALPPQSSASTSFAIAACGNSHNKIVFIKNDYRDANLMKPNN